MAVPGWQVSRDPGYVDTVEAWVGDRLLVSLRRATSCQELIAQIMARREPGVNGIFGRDGAISGSWYGVWVWLVGVSLTWVVLGGEGGYGFDAWFGVSGEGAGVVVSAFGLEKDCGDSFLGRGG